MINLSAVRHGSSRSRVGLTRRLFLGTSAGASLLGRRAFAFESADVIIIGAGLAGLAAAINLESEGVSTIVLEAEGHVGGRVRTYDLPVGPISAGGEVIGPYYARIRDMAYRFDVPLFPSYDRPPMGNYVNGELTASADWQNVPSNKTRGRERAVSPGALEFFYFSNNNPLPDVESWTDPAYADLDISIGQFLRQSGISDEALRLVDVTINVYDSATSSALAYLRDVKRLQWGIEPSSNVNRSMYGTSSEDGYQYHKVVGGTQRLAEAMAAAVKGQVLMNKLVRSIDMSADSVDVRTSDGGRYQGKFVISAVPFTALRHMDISPRFEGPQSDVIHGSTHSNSTRVFLEVTEPFWDNDIGEPGLFTDTLIERVFAITNEENEIVALESWINGKAAYQLDSLPDEAVGKLIVDTLARIRPASKGKVQVMKVHSWAKHSASGCCRHAYEAGEVGEYAGVSAQPWQRLHLAGEQTRNMENGMEAAAKSGERAAFEILERMG